MLMLGLLRHAKSSWSDPGLSDFDRPLNARGEAAAPLMGKALAENGFRPDLILCSPAKRTRQTLARAAPGTSGDPPRIIFDERLYLATAGEWLNVLRTAGDGATAVLGIGHNPGLHTLAVNLAGSGSPSDIGRLTDKFPTAAVALIEFDGDAWADIGAGKGRLQTFITPKERA